MKFFVLTLLTAIIHLQVGRGQNINSISSKARPEDANYKTCSGQTSNRLQTNEINEKKCCESAVKGQGPIIANKLDDKNWVGGSYIERTFVWKWPGSQITIVYSGSGGIKSQEHLKEIWTMFETTFNNIKGKFLQK